MHGDRRSGWLRRVLLGAIAGLVAVFVLLPSGSPASAGPHAASETSARDTMHAGDKLKAGQKLRSPNREYRAVMQRDGNFVVYHDGAAQWSSGTAGSGATRLVLQRDNNLVIYKPGKVAAWNTQTVSTGADRLVMQDDGNLVLYAGTRAVWASRVGYLGAQLDTIRRVLPVGQALVSGNAQYKAALQRDGNFVVYQGSTARWSSGTAGTSSQRLNLQTDGNLVIYDAAGAAVWNAHTAGSGADRLIMQNDGNLVLYAGSRAVWSSRGGLVGQGDIRAPFAAGERWYIYQGYSSGTHTGTSQYGLDLTLGPSTTSTAGRTVRAPASGTISYWQSAYGNLCVNLADGRSYTMTHINASQTSGSVAAGQALGTVAAAGQRGNNGVAHLHFEMWSGRNCYDQSTPIPLDHAHQARMCGAPDLTATGPNGGNGVWSGTYITAASC